MTENTAYGETGAEEPGTVFWTGPKTYEVHRQTGNKFVVKDSGKRQDYASGMRRDTQEGKPRFELLRPEGVPFDEQFLTRVAMLMTRGIDKYGYRNWEKANSEEELNRFKGSAERHLNQYLCGDTEEDHAAAVVFNLIAAETTRYKIGKLKEAEAELDALGGSKSCCNVEFRRYNPSEGAYE